MLVSYAFDPTSLNKDDVSLLDSGNLVIDWYPTKEKDEGSHNLYDAPDYYTGIAYFTKRDLVKL